MPSIHSQDREGFVSPSRLVVAEECVDHGVPPGPIPEGDLAQNALTGEADAFKYLLLRQIVGVGAGL